MLPPFCALDQFFFIIIGLAMNDTLKLNEGKQERFTFFSDTFWRAFKCAQTLQKYSKNPISYQNGRQTS